MSEQPGLSYERGNPPMSENATQRPAARSRLVFLDGIRAVAALYVVLHHIWLTTYPDYPRNSGPVYLGWLIYGHIAVTVFIVVSGYSLALAPARRGLRAGGYGKFLKRRAWRIVPPYWAALGLSCLVFGTLAPNVTGQLVTMKSIIVHAMLVQDVVNSPKPNGAFWSIAIEWQIYFLFPLVLLAFRRLGWLVSASLAILVVVAANGAGEAVGALHGLLNLTPQFFALFVVGAAAASLRPLSDRQGRCVALGSISLFVVFVTCATTLGSVWIDENYFWIDLVVGIATAMMILAVANGGLGWLRRCFGSAIMVRIGAFSYSIYLIHLPLLWITNFFFVSRVTQDPLLNFWLLCAVGVPVVVCGSYVFHLVVERPFVENRSLSAISDGWRRKGRISQRSASVDAEM